MTKKCSRGMTLLELLFGCLIVIALMALLGLQLRNLVQKAKVSAAKVTINTMGSCLGMIRDDTGYYPLHSNDDGVEPEDDDGVEPLLVPPLDFLKKASPPPGISAKDWCGPYGETLPLKDPWGHYYMYELQNTLFGPNEYVRGPGGGQDEFTETFAGAPGASATLRIINPGVPSGEVKLNGVQIVSPNDFQKITPVITKQVTLDNDGWNELYVKLGGQSGITITITITADQVHKDFTFTLWSYGRNGAEGGTGFDTDLYYRINTD